MMRWREVVRKTHELVLSKLEAARGFSDDARSFFQGLITTTTELVKEAEEIDKRIDEPEPKLTSLLDQFEILLSGAGAEAVMSSCALSRLIWASASFAYDRDELDLEDLNRAVTLLDRARCLPSASLRDDRFKDNIRVRLEALSALKDEAEVQTADISEREEGFEEDCLNPESTLTEDQKRRLTDARKAGNLAAIDEVWRDAGWAEICKPTKKRWKALAGLLKGDPRTSEEILDDLRS